MIRTFYWIILTRLWKMYMNHWSNCCRSLTIHTNVLGFFHWWCCGRLIRIQIVFGNWIILNDRTFHGIRWIRNLVGYNTWWAQCFTDWNIDATEICLEKHTMEDWSASKLFSTNWSSAMTRLSSEEDRIDTSSVPLLVTETLMPMKGYF